MSFSLMVQLFYGCITSKEIYYSYKVETYTVDTVKHFLTSSSLISYGDYLFEFRTRINIDRTVYGDFDSTSILYDTMGVYLLSGLNKLYYEFDTFALKNNVIKIGKFADKPFGQKLDPVVIESNSDVSFTLPKKIVINNIDCFITEIVTNNKTDISTTMQKAVLIKSPKFNSLYKINGIKFSDKNYCIVGFQVYDLKNKQNFLQEIESMKPLTAKEKEICANMIKTSKLVIIDTIKAVSRFSP